MEKYEDIKALNWSSLRDMAASPLLYAWRQEHPRPDTAAMALGRAIHCRVLEPDAFDGRYVVRPRGLDGRTKEGKAWAAEQVGRDVLSADDGDLVETCARAVHDHEVAHRIIEGCLYEQALTWVLDGIGCKGRIDALDRGSIVDLKTCRDMGAFARDFARMSYHGQLAWYLDGARLAGAVDTDARAYVVAVETSEPYDVAAFVLPDDVITMGRTLYRTLLDLWVSCREADCWPGRYPALTPLELPRWAKAAAEGEVW